ncbi:hypothetical protein CEXT_385401 [Caerostris extrusa]|uniref:Uncharacterized protein n=1 Tax=Caerostris extrusa TaxID=172846 RepID=A0AAV4NBX9_CAEEX|nr:hypothetical protein CEXT_385401 [Caerostris extrusa]
MQLLSEIFEITLDSNPLMGSTAVPAFRRDEFMHVCNYCEIRFHLWALLQSLFSDVTRLCTYAYYLRFFVITVTSNPLMGSTADAVFKHDEIMHL